MGIGANWGDFDGLGEAISMWKGNMAANLKHLIGRTCILLVEEFHIYFGSCRGSGSGVDFKQVTKQLDLLYYVHLG